VIYFVGLGTKICECTKEPLQLTLQFFPIS
jgi:hypothetical protein